MSLAVPNGHMWSQWTRTEPSGSQWTHVVTMDPYGAYYSNTPIYRAPIYRADRFTVHHPFPPIFLGKFLDLKIKFSNEKSIFFQTENYNFFG